MKIRTALLLALGAVLALGAFIPADDAAGSSTAVWARVTTNNDYRTLTGYRSAWSPILPYGHYHIQAYITDQGNDFHQSEDCIGKINVYRGSDGASLGYLRAETWPVDTQYYHYHVYMDGYWSGRIRVKTAVAAVDHYSDQQSHYINLYDACRLMVSVTR